MIVEPTINTPNGRIGFWLGANGAWYLVAEEHKNSYLERVDICLTTETIKILVAHLMQLEEYMRTNNDG